MSGCTGLRFGLARVESACHLVTGRGRLVLGGAVAAYALFRLAQHLRIRKLRAKWNAAGKDVVVLHTISRANFCPSLSPYALKLETFLRLMDIKYQIDFDEPFGAKGKLPWITLNGEDYTDSELIMQMLQIKFNKFPDSNIAIEDRAAALAMRVMTEEHMMFCLGSWRYIEDNMKNIFICQQMTFFQKMFFKSFKGKLKTMLHAQGIGRHSDAEINQFAKRDMDALSVFLGTKEFLLGASLTVVDCAVFGALCQVLYNSPGSPHLLWINNEYSNLRDYTERVKQRLWPDWNQCIEKPNQSP